MQLEKMPDAPVSSERLKQYLNKDFDRVNGWCSAQLWNVIEVLEAAQRQAGVDAPVCEIGVHHGKFFIGLVNTVRTARKSLAIDLFDGMQDLNIDKSGRGSLKQFLTNVGQYADPSLVEPMSADSLSLGSAEIARILEAHGKFAYFSVDGGHTVEHTINDLRVAMQLTLPAGVIFVDDYYNASWPGVQEGVVRLYCLDTPTFVPLCFTGGKLFLTGISHHARYLEIMHKHITRNYPDSKVKIVQRLGWKTLTIMPSKDGPNLSGWNASE
jgi:hypothetical protein